MLSTTATALKAWVDTVFTFWDWLGNICENEHFKYFNVFLHEHGVAEDEQRIRNSYSWTK